MTLKKQNAVIVCAFLAVLSVVYAETAPPTPQKQLHDYSEGLLKALPGTSGMAPATAITMASVRRDLTGLKESADSLPPEKAHQVVLALCQMDVPFELEAAGLAMNNPPPCPDAEANVSDLVQDFKMMQAGPAATDSSTTDIPGLTRGSI